MFKYSDAQYTSLTPDKILNSLVYRSLFYVNIYGSYILSKNSPFFGPPCILIRQVTNRLQTLHLDSLFLCSLFFLRFLFVRKSAVTQHGIKASQLILARETLQWHSTVHYLQPSLSTLQPIQLVTASKCIQIWQCHFSGRTMSSLSVNQILSVDLITVIFHCNTALSFVFTFIVLHYFMLFGLMATRMK